MFFRDISPILHPIGMLMKAILSERNIVIVLFVMVLITFSLAQEDSKKMERASIGVHALTAPSLLAERLPADKAVAETPAE
jgi:hypothetical protein